MLDFDVSVLFNFDDEFHHHDNIFYFNLVCDPQLL